MIHRDDLLQQSDSHDLTFSSSALSVAVVRQRSWCRRTMVQYAQRWTVGELPRYLPVAVDVEDPCSEVEQRQSD